jgi:pSer/pThr/pTyr-binding forkhead associated (FHA) protein
MAVLIGMSAEVKGRSIPLDEDELTIGRNSDNKLPINNASVSGHHARIARDGDRFILKDLGSTNGTRVNTKDVKEVVLRPKDLIQVGSVELMFNSDEAASDEDAGVAAQTEVVVSKGAAEAPKSFESISPFGARRRETPGIWSLVIGLLAVGALIGLVLFVLRLVAAE